MAMSWLAEKLREVTGTKDHAFQRYRRRSEREDGPAATTVTFNMESHERVRFGRAPIAEKAPGLLTCWVRDREAPTWAAQPRHLTTVGLLDWYKRVNKSYTYDPNKNPRRILTKPGVGVSNNNYDNADGDYILVVNDIIGSEDGHQYGVAKRFGLIEWAPSGDLTRRGPSGGAAATTGTASWTCSAMVRLGRWSSASTSPPGRCGPRRTNAKRASVALTLAGDLRPSLSVRKAGGRQGHQKQARVLEPVHVRSQDFGISASRSHPNGAAGTDADASGLRDAFVCARGVPSAEP